MTNLEKLEYIHCLLQEVQNDIRRCNQEREFDTDMIAQALSFVEDVREPYFCVPKVLPVM